ncbi:N-acetylmuramoyl-L-alanine amidase [Salinicoccus sp. ID82-1]|uniref:N-acetylmuramoyl-L-alanine amidase n=1 Tax=Salinicoccus sp. ID82-1 TaxID=2820269 RepID=UPI001EFF9302|nr:N-acetylmuramoyl-L-alanine amidase [Salinicoccus sp. ID82-1]MCG1009212.1 N-acetylmuramoyl-L-alanine amidase [Salinicoccus sp. ID82-1]
MTLKIGVSRGHGKYTAGKRSPAGEREWYFNDAVAEAFIRLMKQYDDIEIIEVSDPTGEEDTPLVTRTDLADYHGVDVYIAFHHNAYQGVWFNGGGSEVHVRPYASQSHALASIIAPLISKAMGITNRGVKVTNLHETREPNQLAILIEGGFMDSKQDIVAMRDSNKLKAQGEAVALGVAEYFSLEKSAAPAPVEDVTGAIPSPFNRYDHTKVPNSIRVPAGETLWSLADKYGLTVEYLKQRNGMDSNHLDANQFLYVDYDRNDYRSRSEEGAYVEGIVDGLGATVMKRRGSQAAGFRFEEEAGYDLKPGAVVFIFETHLGWGRIFTGASTGAGSNEWIHLNRMIPVRIFKD